MLQLPHILARFAAGGDALIMICLWQLGVGVSDPGFSFYHSDLRMFDSPSAEGRHLLYALTEALAKRCDPSCQVCCTVPLQGCWVVLAETCLLWQGTPDFQARQSQPLPACLLALATCLMPRNTLLSQVCIDAKEELLMVQGC